MRPFRPPPPELLAERRLDSNRSLSASELEAYVEDPWTEEELDDAFALTRWFMRRYATPAERLAAGRAAYPRTKALMPR